MSKLLVNIEFLPGGYLSDWEQVGSMAFDGNSMKVAAEWCQVDLIHFIRTAIEDRLTEVQAAMGEEQVGAS